MGTWVGVTTGGKLSALTNFREPFLQRSRELSRGMLVGHFLAGNASPREYGERLARNAGKSVDEGTLEDVDVTQMAGFNLLCVDLRALLRRDAGGTGGSSGGSDPVVYVTNRRRDSPEHPTYRVDVQYPSEPGRVYGVSNALLDSNWPKIEKGKQRFEQIVRAEVAGQGESATVREENRLLEELFELMSDTEPFSTVDPPKELADLAKCICVPPLKGLPGLVGTNGYGTRSTCVILLAADGTCVCAERVFDDPESGKKEGENEKKDWKIFRFAIDGSSPTSSL